MKVSGILQVSFYKLHYQKFNCLELDKIKNKSNNIQKPSFPNYLLFVITYTLEYTFFNGTDSIQ